jgi:hypothetical protein
VEFRSSKIKISKKLLLAMLENFFDENFWHAEAQKLIMLYVYVRMHMLCGRMWSNVVAQSLAHATNYALHKFYEKDYCFILDYIYYYALVSLMGCMMCIFCAMCCTCAMLCALFTTSYLQFGWCDAVESSNRSVVATSHRVLCISYCFLSIIVIFCFYRCLKWCARTPFYSTCVPSDR